MVCELRNRDTNRDHASRGAFFARQASWRAPPFRPAGSV
jgi:hypothetical protein